MPLQKVQKALRAQASKERKIACLRFFKTGKGEYGEGDEFIGVTVPETRAIAKQFRDLAEVELIRLLASPIHEDRSAALFIMIFQFEKSDEVNRKRIFRTYVKYRKFVNNWDLVDLSAPKIIGAYLLEKDRKLLYTWARSKKLWEKRIAIVASYTFIKVDQFKDTLALAQILMQDPHDLIHKAVGWMLRELGKRNRQVLEKFLQKHHHKMPRTMLRYSIEHFSKTKRSFYLK